MSSEPPSEDVLHRAQEIYRRLAREHHWDFYREPEEITTPPPSQSDARAARRHHDPSGGMNGGAPHVEPGSDTG